MNQKIFLTLRIKITKIILIGLMFSITTNSYSAGNSDENEHQKIKKIIRNESRKLLMYAAENAQSEKEVKTLLAIIKKLDPELDINFIFNQDDNDDNECNYNPPVDDKTVLMYAAKYRNRTIIHALLAIQADPNCTNQNGETALMYAAQHGTSDILQTLLDARADRNKTDCKNQTALMYATHNSDTTAIKALLANQADSDIASQHINNALICAAQLGRTVSVKILLAHNANQDIADKYGKTALMYAAACCHTETTRVILEACYNSCLNALTTQYPVINPISFKNPKISQTYIDLLPAEIIDAIFDQLDAPAIKTMRLMNSNYLLYSHNKFEKIRQKYAISLQKTTLINHIELAQANMPKLTYMTDAKAKVLKLLHDERQKADTLDLLITQKTAPYI